ncbi:MAG: branched-chain amino acid ABC transporter substrate-binding protein [Rhodospirillaceae bacterium]|nr:branched-chain amino acid ABC transporter substrate-binding protein [Rhodospirillaceae bacterium]
MMRMIGRHSAAIFVAAALSAGSAAAANYGPGVTDTEIKLGSTNPFSGPASAYGTIAKAASAYFDKVNAEQGGVNGRKIDFIMRDDGYSPPKTVEQARKLVEQDQVLAMFQNLGTPTNTAIVKYLNAKKVPHLFVATGASKWDQPDKYPWTTGWQPSYQTEAKVYAKYILENLPNAKIGILYQNDDYGKDYLEGFHEGLGDKAKDLIVAEVSYEVTDPTVDSQIISLKDSGADVFFNVTTPKFAAQAIRKAYDIGWHPTQFLNNVSTSKAAVIDPAGVEKAKGIISSYYLKDPTDPQWNDDPAVQAYREFMAQYYPDGDPADLFNIYGYAVAQLMVEVIRKCGDDLTRENLMKQALSVDHFEIATLLPGISVTTGPDDHAALEQLQLQQFDGKEWVLFGDIVGTE